MAISTAVARTELMGVGFGLLDLLFRQGRAAGDEFVCLLLGFGGQHFSFAFGSGNDVGGFRFGFLALALVFNEQGLGFGAQALGFGPVRW